MTQITTRLPSDIRDRFDRYAVEVGLDASELARLLIVREMRVRRLLRSAKGQPEVPAMSAKKYGERKLTAHFHHNEKIVEFDKYRYAVAKGLSRAAAARLIFERELREKWLAQAFAWNPRNRQTRHPGRSARPTETRR